ncbi:MAG: indolepyruvate oxidoreductase subunit beta family protein, partial [candidate division NC10 bacterium]|nr:indolepyruvate oxidoreductase subunit beta family protein [candidate division NC10 bacterium]
MSDPTVIKILIMALGGQGGGVLTEWLFQACLLEDYPVRSTSIPGVAQRTGSTNYYLEIPTQTARELGESRPEFCLYPTTGDVDLLIAPEFLELGRAIEQGFVSPDRTTAIASTHRIFSIYEKMPVGDGLYSQADLLAAARAFSLRLIAFDASDLAQRHGLKEINAIILGAVAASGVLPLREESYIKAIERQGIAVETNLRAFRFGLAQVRDAVAAKPMPRVEETWDQAKQRQADELGHPKGTRGAGEYLQLTAEIERRYPERLWRTLGEALYRLLDYQDAAYARRYLDRLDRIRQLEERVGGATSDRLTEFVAKYLAVWMTYEDAIRVAQYKTRPERFARIAREAGAGPEQLVTVTEYLKPDIEEILGVLPRALVGGLAEWASRRWPGEDKPTFTQTLQTTSFPGFLRLWLVTRLRPLRSFSVRFAQEHAYVAEYLEAVERYAALDLELGCAVARLAQVVKGYGNVRRRTLRHFTRVLREIVKPLADAELHQGNGFPLTREAVERTRTLLLTQPDNLE